MIKQRRDSIEQFTKGNVWSWPPSRPPRLWYRGVPAQALDEAALVEKRREVAAASEKPPQRDGR